jgi:hypothetical protein
MGLGGSSVMEREGRLELPIGLRKVGFLMDVGPRVFRGNYEKKTGKATPIASKSAIFSHFFRSPQRAGFGRLVISNHP